MVEEASRVLDSVELGMNIDRLLKITEDMYLAASYHLDKESGKKTGSITSFKVD